MALVIDASIAVGWIAPTQSSARSRAALKAAAQSNGVVPAHFAMEVLRALRRLERRQLLNSEALLAGLEDLERIGLLVDEANPIGRLTVIHRIAEQNMLAAADAAYLDVAMRGAMALATSDSALARAAEAMGVALFKAETEPE